MPVNQQGQQTAKRSSVQMAVGPLWTRGDAVKADPASTTKARNCALVRGVVEKRPPFTRDKQVGGATATYQIGRLGRFVNTSYDQLIVGTNTNSVDGDYNISGNNQNSYARTAAATYGAIVGSTFLDGANFSDKYWLVGHGYSSFFTLFNHGSWDGAAATTFPFHTTIIGETICSFIGRLFMGNIWGIEQSSKYAFDSAAEWTVGGAWSQPVKDANNFVVATIANGATDTIKSTASVLSSTSTDDLYYTFIFWIQPLSATTSTPITLSIENSGGTTVYAQTETIIPSKSVDPDWVPYPITARVPASTDMYAKLKIGNSSGNGTAGVTFRMSNYPQVGDTSFHGFAAYYGHYAPDDPPGYGTPTYGVNPYWRRHNRVVWCEALDPTDWRATNYLDFTDAPGDIVAIRSVGGRLVIYKNNGILTARPGPSADQAIIRESYFPTIGTTGPKAVATFNNVQYFVGSSQVYALTESGPPEPIISPGMRDEMFASTNLVSFPSIAVDETNRNIWIHTQKYKIYIYSIDDNEITGYYQLTDSNASETPFTPYGDILDMEYAAGKVWVLFLESGVASAGTDLEDICYLDTTATQDTCDGTARDVVAEYVFHPIESARPRQQLTVQTVGLDHKVTGSQTGCTTEYSVSLDNGNTWTKYNRVTLTPLSAGASADTQIMRVPVQQTSPRLLLKIKHTGSAGPSYFNTTGGQADIIVRGREVQKTNPTAGSSSL